MIDRRLLVRAALWAAAARFLVPAQTIAAPGRAPRLERDPFILGVASGDPHAGGFVIWTRLVGLDDPVEVDWELASDPGFRTILRSGRLWAHAERGHSVHAELSGLAPGSDHYYRFHCAGATSRVGRCTTLPADPSAIRLAFTSCQHYEHGWFSAYRDMIGNAPDAVLHLGDYIYEKSFGNGPDVRSFGSGDPLTLDDYRARHALYRTDPDLADAHARLPFIVTWDDHEVENDYAGAQGVATAQAGPFLRRRAAAYQAFFEHMPIAPSRFMAGGTLRLQRCLRWGSLASLYVLDTRQYRAPQACVRGGGVVSDCPERSDPGRSMLGVAQEEWLTQALAEETAQWSLIGQQTLLAPLALPQGGDAAYSDFWDGYPAARLKLLSAMAQPSVANPVVLSGDVHSFWLNDIHCDPADPISPVAATEIVTSCLASRNGPSALFGDANERNLHVRFLDNAHAGYALLDISREALAIRFRAVRDLADPRSECFTLHRAEVPAGERVFRQG